MKIAILGFGREGKSVLKFLRKSKEYRNKEIVICDRDAKLQMYTNDTNTKLQTGKNYLKNLERFDLIFRSPGIPYQTPELFRARCDGVKVSSATILFFKHSPTTRIIGVTGSKGKGTTATLLYNILKSAGKDVYLAGNIGTPALEMLPRLKKASWVILELSSFQLQDLPYSPHIALTLDVFPEHLDHHKSIREYYGSKSNIARFQKKSGSVFYFGDSADSKRIVIKGRGRRFPAFPKTYTLFSKRDLKMRGEHNFRNAVMAATVALKLGVPKRTVLRAVKNFRGLEHRLEFARRISRSTPILTRKHAEKNQRISATNLDQRPSPLYKGEGSASIDFYNDSASTNPHTAAAAVMAFGNEPHILIAGGQDKGLDYRPLAQALKNSSTKLVVLFGENKNKIARALRSSGVPIKFAMNLRSAVQHAYHAARSLFADVIVLFSPGAASFDMFKDYADRGRQFKKLVKTLRVR